MFEEDEWQLLIEKLERITEAGTVDWEDHQTSVSMTAGHYIYILGSVDEDGRPPYYLRIGDDTVREIIASLESEPIPDDSPRSGRAKPTAAQRVPALYAAARRAASGGPARFRELIESLNRYDPDAPPPF